MKKYAVSFLFYFYLGFFIAVWLALTAYTFFSLFNPDTAFTAAHFALFIILLDLIVFPLVWFWWSIGSKTSAHKTGVLLTTLIIVFWWGFFTVYSFLSLRLNDLQLRWIAFAYIWEVVVVGGVIAYLIVRMSRFADAFLQKKISNGHLPFSRIHARITAIPFRAAALFASVVAVGYAIGSLQLFYFAALPAAELAKNLITGIVTGILGSFFIYFGLERILEPAARESAKLRQDALGGLHSAQKPRLFRKIYVISSILVLASIAFFWMMAYNQAEVLLENELHARLAGELENLADGFLTSGSLPPPNEYQSRLGANGELYVTAIAAPYKNQTWVDRAGTVRIRGIHQLRGDTFLAGSMLLDDFSAGLTRFSYSSILVFVMILVLVISASSFFARSIAIPLRELKEAGMRIGRGNFAEPVAVYTNDEIEEVGSALNEAQRQLRTYYSNLEAEVRDRTGRLSDQLRELDRMSKLLVRRDFERQQITDRLREIDEAKTNFVSIAAHQLRTPLSAIKWSFHMLSSGDLGPLAPDQAAIIRQAAESANRLIALIGDLLNVARIESGQIVYTFGSFSIGDMLSRLGEEASREAKEKKLEFEMFLPETQVQASGDEEKLSLALQNILENALNYTLPGGKISISSEILDEDNYRIRISDTGIGIPAHQQTRLFEKFFRADNAVKRQIPGTGLGLYVANHIIEAHGGKIEVESEDNKGTTFIITLPFLR